MWEGRERRGMIGGEFVIAGNFGLPVDALKPGTNSARFRSRVGNCANKLMRVQHGFDDFSVTGATA